MAACRAIAGRSAWRSAATGSEFRFRWVPSGPVPARHTQPRTVPASLSRFAANARLRDRLASRSRHTQASVAGSGALDLSGSQIDAMTQSKMTSCARLPYPAVDTMAGRGRRATEPHAGDPRCSAYRRRCRSRHPGQRLGPDRWSAEFRYFKISRYLRLSPFRHRGTITSLACNAFLDIGKLYFHEFGYFPISMSVVIAIAICRSCGAAIPYRRQRRLTSSGHLPRLALEQGRGVPWPR